MSYNNARPLDVPSAVKFIDASIKGRQGGFFINTDFGRVAIEATYEDYDPHDPVFLCLWENAPATSWCMRHCHDHAKYYVRIGIHPRNSETAIHIRSIEAMTKVVMRSNIGIEPTQEFIDAGVYSYLCNVDGTPPTLNEMEEEYSKIHLGWFARNIASVRELVRMNINIRADMAEQAFQNATQVTKKKGIKYDGIESKYHKDLAIMIDALNGCTRSND